MRRKLIDAKINELEKYKYSSIKELICAFNINLIKKSLTELAGIQSISINNNILINDSLDPLQENFIILHEFGHILLHDSKANCFIPLNYHSKEEREANYFAVKMLMLRENVNLEEVSYLGVPIKELLKLREIGMF